VGRGGGKEEDELSTRRLEKKVWVPRPTAAEGSGGTKVGVVCNPIQNSIKVRG